MCFPVQSTQDAAVSISEGLGSDFFQPAAETSLDPTLPQAGNAPTPTGGAVTPEPTDPRPTGGNAPPAAGGGFFSQAGLIEQGVAGTLLSNPITLERLQNSLLIAAPGSREAERSPLTSLTDDTAENLFSSELGDEQRSAVTRVFEGIGLRAPEFTEEGFLTQQFQQQQLPGFLSFLDDERAAQGRKQLDPESVNLTELGFTTEDVVEDFGGIREKLVGTQADFSLKDIRSDVTEELGFDPSSFLDPGQVVPGANEPGIDPAAELTQEQQLERQETQQAEIDETLSVDTPQVITDQLSSGEITESQVFLNAIRLQDPTEVNDYLVSVGLEPFDLAPITDFTEQGQFIFDAITKSLDTGGEFSQIFPIVPREEGQRRFDDLVFGDAVDNFLFQQKINGDEFRATELGQFLEEAKRLYQQLFAETFDPGQEQIDFVNDFITSGFEGFGVDLSAQSAPTSETEIPTPTDPTEPSGTSIGTPTGEPFVGPSADPTLTADPLTGETSIDFGGLFNQTFDVSALDSPQSLEVIRGALIGLADTQEGFTSQQIEDLADDELRRLILESLQP